MPAAVNNYYIRSLLGSRFFQYPIVHITPEHVSAARLTVAQQDLLLSLEDKPRNDLTLRVGLGWQQEAFPHRHTDAPDSTPISRKHDGQQINSLQAKQGEKQANSGGSVGVSDRSVAQGAGMSHEGKITAVRSVFSGDSTEADKQGTAAHRGVLEKAQHSLHVTDRKAEGDDALGQAGVVADSKKAARSSADEAGQVCMPSDYDVMLLRNAPDVLLHAFMVQMQALDVIMFNAAEAAGWVLS